MLWFLVRYPLLYGNFNYLNNRKLLKFNVSIGLYIYSIIIGFSPNIFFKELYYHFLPSSTASWEYGASIFNVYVMPHPRPRVYLTAHWALGYVIEATFFIVYISLFNRRKQGQPFLFSEKSFISSWYCDLSFWIACIISCQKCIATIGFLVTAWGTFYPLTCTFLQLWRSPFTLPFPSIQH